MFSNVFIVTSLYNINVDQLIFRGEREPTPIDNRLRDLSMHHLPARHA